MNKPLLSDDEELDASASGADWDRDGRRDAKLGMVDVRS